MLEPALPIRRGDGGNIPAVRQQYLRATSVPPHPQPRTGLVKIDQGPGAFLRNSLHGPAYQIPTIAIAGAEDVAVYAMGMNAHQRGGLLLNISPHQCQVRLRID